MNEKVYLQPATLDYMRDVVIDDSRARRKIGWVSFFICLFSSHCSCALCTDMEHWYMRCDLSRYRPLWETVQIIKYAVDQVESGRVRRGSVTEW